MTYYDELCNAMAITALDPNVLFIGQGVGNAGTTMSSTLDMVPMAQRIEFPVAEDLQMGFCTGMSLTGITPVCIFPRWNFMLCAMNQLVNHLDRLPLYSTYKPKVIIRVATPSVSPFYPGPQHDDDFSAALKLMLRTVHVRRLEAAEEIVPAYQWALETETSTILVEYTDLYKDDIAKEAEKWA